MLRTLLEYSAAAAWALIVMVLTMFPLAFCFGQSLDGITGWWQAVPLLGQLAIVVAAGVWSFGSALKGFRSRTVRRES